MSCGWPTRPSGIRRTEASRTSLISSMGAAIGVQTKVGAIALTLMPCGAQSIARLRVRATTAPLEDV